VVMHHFVERKIAHFHTADIWQVKWMFTGYGLDGQSSITGSERFSSSRQRPNRLQSPPSLLYPMGTGGSFPGKGCEADHSPTSSAEVKKSGAIPPLSHVIMA
jgi:hypothetical protein